MEGLIERLTESAHLRPALSFTIIWSNRFENIRKCPNGSLEKEIRIKTKDTAGKEDLLASGGGGKDREEKGMPGEDVGNVFNVGKNGFILQHSAQHGIPGLDVSRAQGKLPSEIFKRERLSDAPEIVQRFFSRELLPPSARKDLCQPTPERLEAVL
jgi:hypothetical protein